METAHINVWLPDPKDKRIAELEAALAAIVKRGGHMSGGVAHELVVIARKALTSVTSDKP